MILRDAAPADLQAVLAVERAAFGAAAWSEAMLGAELGREGGVFLVCEREGRLLGHAIGRRVADEAEVLEIGVDPAARRQGLGRALLAALEARLAAGGARVCWLEVRLDNAAAQALYRERGYAVVGQRPRYYPDGQDAVIMARELND